MFQNRRLSCCLLEDPIFFLLNIPFYHPLPPVGTKTACHFRHRLWTAASCFCVEMVEGDNSSSTPIAPEISVLSGVHIFLKLTGSWKRAFPYLRTFWLCFRKNTVECLGRLSCILLRRNYKEVMGNPWTFFLLLSLLPALANVHHGLQGKMEQLYSKSCCLNNKSSLIYSFCFLDSSGLSFLCQKKREEWKAPQETLRY